jgi:hypothetical protein
MAFIVTSADPFSKWLLILFYMSDNSLCGDKRASKYRSLGALEFIAENQDKAFYQKITHS